MKEIIQIETKFNRIFEFSRGDDGNKEISIIDFANYFYVKDSDLDLVLNLIEHKIERKFVNEFSKNMPQVIPGFTSLYGEQITKVIPNKFEFWKIRKMLWAEKIPTYEYTIDVYLKYLLSLKNPKFSTKRKVGIIDIETDMSLDCENAPKAINAITIFNYQDNKYYTWILKNSKNEEVAKRENPDEILFIFDNDCEDDMLKHFMEKFKEFDFDVVGGWNSMNYDFPYIINRINVLGLNANNLSRFSDYEEEAVSARKFTLYTKKGIRTNFSCQILGVELVDFIPILQKNVCYKPQPSSWSLKSTANFYLGEKSQKLVKIGAGAWENNINDFITYNIKDVDIVRELIDAFKLIDFFVMIQTEIAPVPLNHVTHNSVVLLYYLKFLHPEKIFLDNPGYKKIENEYVDLSTHRIKMKAAHVVEPVAGLHEYVSILDFAGLYPSIFRTFNISPETLSNDGIEIDDITMWKMGSATDKEDDDDDDEDPAKTEIIQEWNLTRKFSQGEKGLYPSLLKNLVDKRTVNKNLAKEYKKLYGEKDFRTILQESRGDVLKQIANSLYGVNGFNKTILFNPIIGAAVTSVSRKLIKHVKEYVNNKEGFKVLTGDTDSLMIRHPKEINVLDFEKEVNAEIQRFVYEKWPTANKENYCLNFEYAKTYKTYVMKDAKKKYYGYLLNGEFNCKGFCIIQHVLSPKIKDWIKEIYIRLMNREPILNIKARISEIKREFYSLDESNLYQEIKLANNPDTYTTKVHQAEAAQYSNTYLGTHFKGGDSGKLVYIKQTGNKEKYPKTEYVFLDEDTKVPNELLIDYERSWDKLFIDNIKILEGIPEFDIDSLVNKNTKLCNFF